jgi:hypothetical protein
VDAHFLAFALGQINQFAGDGEAHGLFEKRAQAAAQRTAGDVRDAESVFDDGIIGAADFERAFAGANVQTGLAVDLAF